MEEWITFLNKEVVLIFEDGDKHYSKKEGKLIEVNETHLVLLIENNSNAFNRTKVLRVQEIDND